MKSLEQLHEICERMRKVVQLREENAKEILEKAAMCESGKDADGNTYRTHVLERHLLGGQIIDQYTLDYADHQ